MSAMLAPKHRRLTQAEVDLICAKHDRLWAARPGGARAVFSWCDLSGLNLSNRNLNDADLTGAILADCRMKGTRLDHATLYCADLQHADMTDANLERSRMSGVIAIKADFTDAVLKDAKLVRANLKQATLTGANLAGADLSGADLAGADLRAAILVGATTSSCQFGGALMDGVLTDKLPPGGVLPYAELLMEHAQWCESQGVLGKPSSFDGADLRLLASVKGYNLTALSAKGATFYNLDMEGVQMQGAQLAGAAPRR